MHTFAHDQRLHESVKFSFAQRCQQDSVCVRSSSDWQLTAITLRWLPLIRSETDVMASLQVRDRHEWHIEGN